MTRRPRVPPPASRMRCASPAGAAVLTDGGRAWGQVATCFVSTFTVYGVNYSYGAFFKSMASDLHASRAAAALVFGITTFFLFVLGLITGPLTDRFGPRPVLAVGAASLGIGLWLTSLVGDLRVGYVTFGLGMGIATACAYVPMVAVVSGWFVRRRAAAVGVAVAGIGAGNLVMNPVSARLIDHSGWRSTYRLYAFVGAALLVGCALVARRPPGGASVGSPLSHMRRAAGTSTFRWLYLATLLMTLTLFTPFVHLTNYAKERGIASGRAALLVGLIGAASIGGRVVFGMLGGRFGVLRLYQGSFLVMALSSLIWLAAGSSYALLVVFVVVMGVSYGAFIALAPTVAAERFGTVGLGAIIGALYTGAGVGGLIGPPLAGWTIDHHGYRTAILTSLVVGLTAFTVLLPIGRTGEARGPTPVPSVS